MFDRLAALEKKLAEATTPAQPSLPRLLTAQELADLLRTTPKAIQRLRDKGLLPAPLDIGGKKLLWREATVIAWLGHTELRDTKVQQ
jgi:predicted DNA-binding transcriptional regulator AlpA